MKPGYKTTEFWLSLLAYILGWVLYESGFCPEGSTSFWCQTAFMVYQGLIVAGYSISRGIAKKGGTG